MKKIFPDGPLQEFDPYKILGLDKNATLDQVRDAYRNLAMKHHPQVNPSPEAKKVF